jgi:hypothetical protein
MKIKKIVKNILKLILVMWCAFSFVLMDFNPMNWSVYVRVWFGIKNNVIRMV